MPKVKAGKETVKFLAIFDHQPITNDAPVRSAFGEGASPIAYDQLPGAPLHPVAPKDLVFCFNALTF